MKKFITVESLVQKINSKEFTTWIDKLTFYHLLFVWAVITLLFGLVYFFFTNGNSYLFRISEGKAVNKVADTIYFSFVGSTTTGYGDIIPEGFFKFIYPFEVILALMMVAIVTSKLVSIKQDVILNEIYGISFDEKINRLRASLLVFRQNLSRVINKIEENSIRKREVSDLYIYISSLEDALTEIILLMDTSGSAHFKKTLDPLNTELLFNSILHSFEKLNELMNVMHQSKLTLGVTAVNLANSCISLSDELFAKLTKSKSLTSTLITDFNMRKKELTDTIRNRLKEAEQEQQKLQNVVPNTNQEGSKANS